MELLVVSTLAQIWSLATIRTNVVYCWVVEEDEVPTVTQKERKRFSDLYTYCSIHTK